MNSTRHSYTASFLTFFLGLIACAHCLTCTTEGAALQRFRDSVAPFTSLGSDWDSLGDDPCGLTGVTCDGGKVTRLVMAFDNLAYAVPPEIGCLTSLQLLNLMGNEITSVPAELAAIPTLTYVDISSNKLKAIPEEWANFASVVTLNLANNAIATLPSDMGGMTSVETLNLNNNKITHLPSLSGASNLKTITVARNALSSIADGLAGLTSLTELTLADNSQLTELPPSIGECSALTKVVVYNTGLTGLPESIGDCSALVHLDISNNEVATVPDSLNKLVNLEFLYLSGNYLTSVPDLSALNKVKELRLSNNDISELPDMFSGWSVVEVVQVQMNKLKSLPPSIGALTTLTVLKAYTNELETIPELNSAVLESLYIYANKITALPELNHPSLKYLSVSNNENLTALPDLSGTALASLWMENTKIVELPSLPTTVTSIRASKSCLADPSPVLTAAALSSLDLTCTYAHDTAGFVLADLQASQGAGIKAYTTDFSACPWLHCPNAQKFPLVSGEEETAFNVFGSCRPGYECSGIGPGGPCGEDTYSLGGETHCPVVPAGSYTDTTLRNVLNECLENFACAGGDDQPTACQHPTPAGSSVCAGPTCTAGEFLNGAACETCPAGTFSNTANAAECTACEPGYASAAGASACQPCAGFSDAQFCKKSTLPDGTAVLVPSTCPDDSYITGDDRKECKKCSIDYKCDGTTKHEFTIKPFTSVDPTTVSGFLTIFVIVLVLAGAAGGTMFAIHLKKRTKTAKPVDSSNLGELIVV